MPPATFIHESLAAAADEGIAAAPTRFYHREGNPTVRALEEVVAALECGERALASSSGMGAIATRIRGLYHEPGYSE